MCVNVCFVFVAFLLYSSIRICIGEGYVVVIRLCVLSHIYIYIYILCNGNKGICYHFHFSCVYVCMLMKLYTSFASIF